MDRQVVLPDEGILFCAAPLRQDERVSRRFWFVLYSRRPSRSVFLWCALQYELIIIAKDYILMNHNKVMTIRNCFGRAIPCRYRCHNSKPWSTTSSSYVAKQQHDLSRMCLTAFPCTIMNAIVQCNHKHSQHQSAPTSPSVDKVITPSVYQLDTGRHGLSTRSTDIFVAQGIATPLPLLAGNLFAAPVECGLCCRHTLISVSAAAAGVWIVVYYERLNFAATNALAFDVSMAVKCGNSSTQNGT